MRPYSKSRPITHFDLFLLPTGGQVNPHLSFGVTSRCGLVANLERTGFSFLASLGLSLLLRANVCKSRSSLSVLRHSVVPLWLLSQSARKTPR